MLVKRIEGCTRVLGKSQGYMGLPIKDIMLDGNMPAMQSAWELTPGELDRLQRGGSLILEVLGVSHPPVKLTVKEPS